MAALIEGFKALGLARLAAMAAVALGVLGLLAMLVLKTDSGAMALLYSDLDMKEAAQAADALAAQHIPTQLGAQGTEILVPAADVGRARLLLAKDGLPTGGSIGYEIFDRGSALTETEFQQAINQTRAMEGELERTIRGIAGVRGARVHLVLPHRDPFARDSQPAQASVMITASGPGRVDKQAVAAIVTLVAAAVPGLRPQGVAVVDSRGAVLARAGEPVGPSQDAQNAEEMRHATELRLARAVEEMLEPTLGLGRVRAEASVDMDFSKLNETKESFDPDGQVVRSSQTVNSNSKSTEAAPTVSVQNNLPNADAGAPQTGSQDGRQEETTNYEIGRTVRTLVREQPQIKRITLAVLVGAEQAEIDGKTVQRPRPPEQLAQIASLVKSAVGFDEKRGDVVEVQSMPMQTADDLPSAPPAGLFGFAFDKADLLGLAQTLMTGLVVVAALVLVLRPMVARLTALPGADGAAMPLLAGGGGAPELAGPAAADATALPGPIDSGQPLLTDESMVTVGGVEGRMRASSLRRMVELAERHPEETLGIIRGWLGEEPPARA